MSDKFVFEQDVHRRTDMHFDDVDDKITFNTVTNYYVVDGKKYMLEVTYYNSNNIEVSDHVFIQVK